MQIPIELTPDQLAKAQQAAARQGDSLSTLIQNWIDRLPAPADSELPQSLPTRKPADVARLAAVNKVLSMTPEERRHHHASVIARVEEEVRDAKSASPQKILEADRELAAFKQAMNGERALRGAEPLFQSE